MSKHNTKNMDQLPGYAQRQPHQPGVEKSRKTKNVAATTAKAAKVVAKQLGATCVSKFEQDEMERENMLDATPHLIFTPAPGHIGVLVADLNSDAFDDNKNDSEMLDLDKGNYQPGTAEDYSDNLFEVPTSPMQKKTFAEAASPRGKARVAPIINAASSKQRLIQYELGTTTESEYPPHQAMKPTKLIWPSVSAFKTQTSSSKAMAKGDEVNLTTESDSATPPTTPSTSLSPKTPVPRKRTKQSRMSSMAMDTEPNSLSHEVKPHALQQLRSFLDLESLDETPCRPMVKLKKLLGSKAADLKVNDQAGSTAGDSTSHWREWKAREPSDEKNVEINPAGRKSGTWEKGVGKAALETINDLMISSDRNGNVSSSTNKGKIAMGKTKVKGKGKEKAVEEEAGGVMEFIIPMLPT